MKFFDNNNEKNNIENSNQNLNNLYNTSYDPNRDFTTSSSNNKDFNTLMSSTNDIRNQKPDNEEILLEEYIGKNSKKIINGKFNIFAFLFSIFYLFYRKLLGIGILLSLIIAGLSYLISPYIVIPLVSLGCGFVFNLLYVMYAKHRIKKIEYNHPDASLNQLTNYVQNEGGTNGDLIAKGILADIFLGILIIAVLITFGVGTTWNKLLSNFNFKEILSIFKKKEIIQKEFDGNYKIIDNINSEDYFTFTIPQNYNKTKNNEYTNGTCQLTFGSVKNYKAADILIGSMQKYYRKLYDPNNKNDYMNGTMSDLEIKTYNKVNWEGFYKSDSNGYNHYYATDYKDKVFLVEVKSQSNNQECDYNLYEFMQTIETK